MNLFMMFLLISSTLCGFIAIIVAMIIMFISSEIKKIKGGHYEHDKN